MRAWKKSASGAGYDQEELYFYQKDLERRSKAREQRYLWLIRDSRVDIEKVYTKFRIDESS